MLSPASLSGVDLLSPEASADVRSALRRASQVVPLAWSAGARRFGFQAPLTLGLPAGSYALLTTDEGERYLGQLLDRSVSERAGATWTMEVGEEVGQSGVRDAQVQVPFRLLEGSGELLVRIEGDEFVPAGAEDTFREAQLEPGPPELVGAYLASVDARATLLDIGLTSGGSPAHLHAQGFSRHTFLCGQSGAGKTYALGVILERLLMETSLPLVILDPNGDFVKLGSAARGDERYREAAHGVRAFSPGHEPLRLRFGELSPEIRAAVLGLDPLADREEYGLFARLAEDRESLADIREATAAELSSEGRELALRIDNLDVGGWGIWARQGETSVLDALRTGSRAAVVDISSPDTPEEQAVAAGAVLEHLWRERGQRRPTLIVIDEAHNVCPAKPAFALQARTRDQVVRIAGEGRKYGLYLLLVTQRPDKLEDNALTQCDNVVLMRLNGAADAARLAGAFSFIPPSLIAEAPTFVKGEGLIVGGIAGRPMRVRFGTRFSEEGGGDVPTTWAER